MQLLKSSQEPLTNEGNEDGELRLMRPGPADCSWHKDAERSTIPNRMVRIKAFILILALIVAPVASLCGAQSSVPGKCPPLCPMGHGTHAPAEQTDEMQADEMECHHGKSTKQDCVMKSGCSHTLDLRLASPLPPAVLCLPMELIAAGVSGAIRFTGTIPSLAGFKIPPFQPPRAQVRTLIS
jgi:hypothetical protein